MVESNGSFKKVVALTGLTVLVGGAGIGEADAATIVQTDTFSFSAFGTVTDPNCCSFSAFNTAQGNLTGVTYSLNSFVQAVCRQSISDSWLGNLRECLAHLV